MDATELAVLAWDGASRGTADGIRKAQAKGIPVEVVPYSSVE